MRKLAALIDTTISPHHEGHGPDYIKMGGKLVAYRVGDLRSWLDANRRSKANAA